MSYCRFSPESDVYVYADVAGGFTTHVANNNITNEYLRDVATWAREGRLRDLPPPPPLKLPHAGMTFNDETIPACILRLLSLRECGYKVPEYALERLRRESGQVVR